MATDEQVEGAGFVLPEDTDWAADGAAAIRQNAHAAYNLAAQGAKADAGGTVTATDAPTAPTEGASASYLVTSAVVWPAGLVWSTDPDGGTAPTITDAALVSFFTLGGTTYAVMGSTYPAATTTTTTTTAATTTTTTTTAATTTTTTTAGVFVDPSDVPGLDLWLDAGTLALADGEAVATWDDLSGVGNHATQGTAGNRPVYKTAIVNGKPVVRFDSTQTQYLASAASTSGTSQTTFAVVKLANNSAGERAVLGTQTGGIISRLEAQRFSIGKYGTAWLAQSPTSGSYNGSTFYVFRFTYAPTTAEIARNSEVVSAEHTHVPLADKTAIVGAAYLTASSAYMIPMGGDIAEVVHYTGTLTEQNISDVTGYLATKYGITL